MWDGQAARVEKNLHAGWAWGAQSHWTTAIPLSAFTWARKLDLACVCVCVCSQIMSHKQIFLVSERQEHAAAHIFPK